MTLTSINHIIAVQRWRIAMIDTELIKRFTKNFTLLRKAAGWTEDDIAKKITVSRPTIANIDKGKITVPIYMAIRTQMETEIFENEKEMELLKYALDAYVDHPNNYTPAQKKEIEKKANIYSSALRNKNNNRKEVATIVFVSLAAVLGTIAAAVITTWRKNKP